MNANEKAPREIYKPASLFIPGTNLRSNIDRWEVISGRVYVTFRDGTVMHSEETPGSLRRGGFATPA